LVGLTIDRAQASEVGPVVALLDAAAAWQESRGIDLWHPGGFESEVAQTIAAGDLFVGRQNGVVVGCFMLDDGSPRMTGWLIAHDRRPTPGVVGRLAVARNVAGQGFGIELLRAADRVASDRGIDFLRLECPSDNQGLRRYYRAAGFSHCGDNDLPGPNGEPWVSSVYERQTKGVFR
jgi:ribosomal protein S18 acetylase RimI-like enzyme